MKTNKKIELSRRSCESLCMMLKTILEEYSEGPLIKIRKDLPVLIMINCDNFSLKDISDIGEKSKSKDNISVFKYTLFEILDEVHSRCMNSERALQIIQRFPPICTIRDIKLMCAYSDYHYYVQASDRDRQGVLLEESDWNILKKYFGYA